jgi:hypothetical protein
MSIASDAAFCGVLRTRQELARNSPRIAPGRHPNPVSARRRASVVPGSAGWTDQALNLVTRVSYPSYASISSRTSRTSRTSGNLDTLDAMDDLEVAADVATARRVRCRSLGGGPAARLRVPHAGEPAAYSLPAPRGTLIFVAALTILAAAVHRLLEPQGVATGAPASPPRPPRQ